MRPLVNELKTSENAETIVCITGQHRQILNHVPKNFKVIPNYGLSIMADMQTLFGITNP